MRREYQGSQGLKKTPLRAFNRVFRNSVDSRRARRFASGQSFTHLARFSSEFAVFSVYPKRSQRTGSCAYACVLAFTDELPFNDTKQRLDVGFSIQLHVQNRLVHGPSGDGGKCSIGRFFESQFIGFPPCVRRSTLPSPPRPGQRCRSPSRDSGTGRRARTWRPGRGKVRRHGRYGLR